MLFDLHKDFSGGRSGGLVFPSKNFPQFVVIHIVKDFDIVNKAEVDVFLELSGFPSQREDILTNKKKHIKIILSKVIGKNKTAKVIEK